MTQEQRQFVAEHIEPKHQRAQGLVFVGVLGVITASLVLFQGTITSMFVAHSDVQPTIARITIPPVTRLGDSVLNPTPLPTPEPQSLNPIQQVISATTVISPSVIRPVAIILTQTPPVTQPTYIPAPTPKPTPVVTPLPTPTPTPLPTVEPTPLPTIEPTPAPTEEPTPTPTPVEEPTPTPSVEEPIA